MESNSEGGTMKKLIIILLLLISCTVPPSHSTNYSAKDNSVGVMSLVDLFDQFDVNWRMEQINSNMIVDDVSWNVFLSLVSEKNWSKNLSGEAEELISLRRMMLSVEKDYSLNKNEKCGIYRVVRLWSEWVNRMDILETENKEFRKNVGRINFYLMPVGLTSLAYEQKDRCEL